MNRLRVMLLVWLLGSLGIAASAAAPEYEVYRAFLSSSYVEKVDYLLYEKLGIFFIYNVKHEDPAELVAFFKARADFALDPDLAKAFVAVNRSPKKIDKNQFPKTMGYSSQFIRKNVYSLSRVGFNAGHDQALVYASFSSLMEDGHGSFFFLKKNGDAWAVTKAAAVWMYGASVHPFNP